MKLKPLLYLAAPYTHDDPMVCTTRFRQVTQVAGYLMNRDDWAVYSPVTQGHMVHIMMSPEAAKKAGHHFWMSQCLPMLDAAEYLYILPLQGWLESKGLREELEFWNTRRQSKARLLQGGCIPDVPESVYSTLSLEPIHLHQQEGDL